MDALVKNHNKFKDALTKMETKLSKEAVVDYSTIKPNPSFANKKKREMKLKFAVSTTVAQSDMNAIKQLTHGGHWLVLVYDEWPAHNHHLHGSIDKFHLSIDSNHKIVILVQQASVSSIEHYEVYAKEYVIKRRAYPQLIAFSKKYHARKSTYMMYADNCRKFCMDFALYCGILAHEIDYTNMGQFFYFGVNSVKGTASLTKTVGKHAGLAAIKVMQSGVSVVESIHNTVHNTTSARNSNVNNPNKHNNHNIDDNVDRMYANNDFEFIFPAMNLGTNDTDTDTDTGADTGADTGTDTDSEEEEEEEAEEEDGDEALLSDLLDNDNDNNDNDNDNNDNGNNNTNNNNLFDDNFDDVVAEQLSNNHGNENGIEILPGQPQQPQAQPQAQPPMEEDFLGIF